MAFGVYEVRGRGFEGIWGSRGFRTLEVTDFKGS